MMQDLSNLWSETCKIAHKVEITETLSHFLQKFRDSNGFTEHSVEKYYKTRSRSKISVVKTVIWRKNCVFSRKNGDRVLDNFSTLWLKKLLDLTKFYHFPQSGKLKNLLSPPPIKNFVKSTLEYFLL